MKKLALGAYELSAPIGSGGLADVWSARNSRDGRTVAVKFMREGATADDQMARAAFRDEIEAVASLEHPHIVRLLDFGDVPAEIAHRISKTISPGSPYLVLEFVGGGSMETAELPDNWRDCRGALSALLSALAHSHARGIAHRDIKPANVLLADGDDPWGKLKLSDFGTAHQHRSTNVGDLERRFAGTLTWAAPEQVKGEWRDFGPWTDLYSLGCLAYYLATGAPPFQAEHWAGLMDLQLNAEPPPMALNCSAPAGFEAWVRRLLHKEPEGRFRSAAQARSELLALDGDAPEMDAGYPDRGTAPPAGAGLSLLVSRRLPLVGRDLERAILWDSLHATATHGRTQAVVVRGPAGVGKTRLAQWLCESAHEHAGFETVHLVHENPPGPRHGLGPMVQRTLRLAGLEQPAARDRIAARLQLGDGAEWVADGLAGLVLGSEKVGGDGPALAAAFVRSIAARRPTILWMEDVHHGLDSLGFARGLLASNLAARLPLLILMTADAHAEGLDDFTAQDDVEQLTLEPLSEEERRELLDALLPLEANTRARLVARRTVASTHLTRQVAQWARNDELVPVGDGTWGLSLDVEPAGSESQFMAAIEATSLVPDMPEDELACIEYAAILGDSVGIEEWALCCRASGSLGMPRALDALYRIPLARRGERGLTFLSEGVRDSVLDGLRARGQWKAAHQVCAEALARHSPLDPRIGRLWIEAGQVELGGELLLGTARRYNTNGELGAALGELDRLDAAHSRDSALRLEALLLKAAVLIERSAFQEARVVAADVATRAEALREDDIALRARLREAQSTAYDGDSEAAFSLTRAVAARTDAGAGTPATRAFAQRVLGLQLAHQGANDEAERRLQDGLDLYTELDDLVGQVNLLHHLTYLRIRQGNPATAELHARLGLDLAQAAGYGKVLMHLEMCLGEVARARGNLDEAYRLYGRARALQIQRGSRPYASSLNLSIVSLLRREYRETARWASEASHVVRGSLAALAAMLRMPAALEAGDHGEWDRLWSDVCSEVDRGLFRDPDFALVAEHVGMAAFHAGAESRARAVLRFALELYEALNRHSDVARLRALVPPPSRGPQS